MTKNDIGQVSKPIFILNTNGIFDDLITHISKLIKEGFVTKDLEKIKVFVSSNPLELASLINSYNF
jgi:predicted Rossmann-fold nucleotide-binding protein